MSEEKKILIIDPHHDERTVMAAFLRGQDYQVETGDSLTEAIKKLSNGDFACLILDVDLPEMKGYEAVSILKNLKPHIKIIMTTQRNSKELEAKVREQDIFFYFIKSFGKDELSLAINNVFTN
jgi:two-component system response regulator PilR (NtrC family)/two-component system response regulator HydG